MRSLTAYLRGLYNKPVLASAEFTNAVLDALEAKDETFFKDVDGKEGGLNRRSQGKAALIEVDGALTYKPAPCSGLTSYTALREVVKEITSDGSYSHLVMMMNSPGGMAYMAFETARWIRKELDAAGMKLITYIDGMAESAGYALTAISDEIIANPMAEAGSIGVRVALRNDLPKEIKDGKERIFITDGEGKVPLTAEGHFTKEFLDETQKRVSELGVEFRQHVSSFRGISEEELLKIGAKSYLAKDALEIGLIDKVMEREAFFSYLSETLKEETNKQEINTLDQNAPTMSDYQALQEQLVAATKANEQLTSKIDEVVADNKQMATALQDIVAKQKEAKQAELVATLSAFEFVEDAQAVATLFSKLESEEAKLISTSFANAQAKIAEAKTEAKKDEETADFFEMSSLQVDGDAVNSSNESVTQLLANKYSKGDK